MIQRGKVCGLGINRMKLVMLEFFLLYSLISAYGTVACSMFWLGLKRAF